MRRLSRTLVEHHGGSLRDDASLLLLEWGGGSAREIHERLTVLPAGPSEGGM